MTSESNSTVAIANFPFPTVCPLAEAKREIRFRAACVERFRRHPQIVEIPLRLRRVLHNEHHFD